MSELTHIRQILDQTRLGLQEWMAHLIVEAGEELPVAGVIPSQPRPPTLVVLPYQIVLESQSTVPTLSLVPAGEKDKDTIPPAWQRLARGMTTYLMDHYPRRAPRGQSVGPLDPAPQLDQLRGELAAWYRAHGRSWMIGEDRGKLPSVQWRQPFSFVVRFATFVVDTSGENPELDRLQLVALALVAAGIRHRRHFEVLTPPEPIPEELRLLCEAMGRSAAPELGAQILADLEAVQRPLRTAVGVYPHHELSDRDLATVMQALRQPMQPAVVFALRLSLGAGPLLEPGATPHIRSVEMGGTP